MIVERDSRQGGAPLLVIVGPTAVGKSSLGLRLAQELDGEIISADSMQVYRGFDIGTGKVSPAERRAIPHHLIDIVEPADRYSAARFVEDAEPIIDEVAARGRQPIIVGGTGLYVRALLHGLFPTPEVDPRLRSAHEAIREERGTAALHRRLLEVDPQTAQRVDENDFVRISRALEIYEQLGRPASELRREHAFRPWRHAALIVGLRLERARLAATIDARVDAMLQAGWLEEVRELCAAGHQEAHPMGALGYRQLAAHLRGECSYEEAVRLTKRDTRRFARRQRNWFGHEDAVQVYDEPFSSVEASQLRAQLAALASRRRG